MNPISIKRYLYLNLLSSYLNVPDVMVLNEIIEQAGRQSRASDQNGTTLHHTILIILMTKTRLSAHYILFYQRSMFISLSNKLTVYYITTNKHRILYTNTNRSHLPGICSLCNKKA